MPNHAPALRLLSALRICERQHSHETLNALTISHSTRFQTTLPINASMSALAKARDGTAQTS